MRFIVSCAFLFALLPAIPAAAQYIVIGESAASACYQHAAFERSDISAVADCDSAIDREMLQRRDRAATYVNRGIIQMRRGVLEPALADFDAAERLQRGFGPALAVNRSAAYIRMARYHDAIAQTDIAIAADAENLSDAWFNRGVALEMTGDTRGAYYAFERALAIRPDWRAAQRELARFTVEPAS
jgi:tetratricopeptide (TPR) repeat protein